MPSIRVIPLSGGDNLQGRVAWVEYLNPHRGAKLRAMLDSVRWD